MSRSNLSFVEAKSMGSVGSAPSHDLLMDDMDVEMNSDMFSDEYGMQYDMGRRVCLEHSYCLVPIPEQDIEVQVISEIETTEKIGDELITISDMNLEEAEVDDVVTAEAEDANQELQECNKGDEPVVESLKNAEHNSVKVEEDVNDVRPEKQEAESVKEDVEKVEEVAKTQAEENVKALAEDDESVEQAIREVEEDVKEIEKETAEQSMAEQISSVSSPQVRRSKRQMEKFERDQLERIKTESLEIQKRETEVDSESQDQVKDKSDENMDDKASHTQMEDKSISEEEDLKLSESILDINEAVDVLLKMEASCSGVSSLQLPSTAMAGGPSISSSSAVTVEKLFTSDLQPSLMVPNDIFDVTPDSLPVSEEGASTEPRLSDPISPQSFEVKAEEPKRTGLLTDDFFGRVVQKKAGEVVKKSGVGSGERKSYPKRENRKPPGYLMSVFEPELFSKPDKMKKIDFKSEDRQEASRDDGSPQDFEMDAQPADDIEAFLCKAEGVDLPNKSSAQPSDGVEKKDGGKGSPKKKIVRPSKKGGAIVRKKKRLQKGRKKKGPQAHGKSSEQKDSSNDEQNGSDDDEDDDSDDWCSEDDPDRLWCICKQPHNDRFMIGCDRCKDWFHGSCVGVTRKQGREWEKSGKEWICKKCDKESKDGKPKERKLSLKPEDEKLKLEQEDKVSEEVKVIVKTAESTPGDVAKKKEKVAAHPQPSPAPKAEEKIHKDPSVVVKQLSVNLTSTPVAADTSSSSSTQLCIMGCGKPPRPNSIFCSNECILQRADESLKMTSKDKERPKTVKSMKVEAPVKIRPESKRVPVINRRTGVVYQGLKAPFEKDLSVWLKQHPTFEVHNVAKLKKMSSPRKTIQLISAKPIPTDQSESPKGKGSIVRALLEEKKKSPSIVVEAKPKLAATDPRISTESKVQLVHHEVKPGLVRQLSEKRASVELKAKIEPKPKVEAPKPKPAPIKRPSVEGKKVTPEVKPTPVSPPPVLGPEPVRISVRQTLRDSLINRSKDADDLTISADEIKQISFSIEDELFRVFNDTGAKYKAKYRSLIFNIKDVRNPGLFRKILQGRIPPHKLVRMTAEELASKELAMWREREVKHTLEMIKREQEEQMQHAPIIKKTHKGDIEIDDHGFVERPKPKVDAVVEPPAALLTDTTESHRSHLFDLNCKICTGKLIPSTDDEAQVKSSSVSRSISMDSKSPNEENEESSSAAEKEEEVVEEEEKVEDTSTTVTEEKSVEEEGEDVSGKVESENVVKEEEKREKGNLKRKESSKSNVSASKKKVKKVRIQKVTFSKAILSESSDREPSSTVTISSPDSAGASYNEDPNSKTPSVWKGFITMQDVAKFVTNAYKVSGPTDFLNQDIPDTIQVCGRITPSIVWDYLSKVKHSGNKEFLVIRFAPANEEEKVSYISFYTYLSSRSRFGVVGNSSRMIKDFYILPLSAQDPVPATLLPFDGPGFEEPRPHMLLGIIIRHRGKRKADTGEPKSKRSDSLEESIDADDVSEILIGKKVKFDLPEKGAKDDKIPYEPSCTPPLRSSKKKRRKKTTRSTTPPLDQLTGKNGDSNSPYSPSRSGPMDDDDKPYDPEEPAGDGKVSKALIPGLLSGSVSSQSVSELIDQISMSSNPAEITTTVLASIATATNLEQQRKLLIELTQKVEEQKRQLEMQKQQIASKVTAQVMGVIPAFTSMVPTDGGLGLQSLGLPKTSLGVSESEEAYSPSYTPPLQQSATYDPEPASLKLPDTSNISLPPNLQEILESIKKQGSAASVSTAVGNKEELAPVKTVNVMLEDPIVKNFADIDPAFADEDLSSIPVPSPPKAIAEEPEAVKLTEAEEEEGVRTPPLQPVKPKDPRQQRKQVDPRMKGKVQLEIGKIRKKFDTVGQKKSELSGLSAAELLEKAMKQFDDTNTSGTTAEEKDQMEMTTPTTTSAWPKFGKISQNLLPPNVAAVEASSLSEPPPPGMEGGSEVSDNTGNAFLPESIPLPSIPLPPSAVVNPVVNYPVPPHPFMGPPPPFMGPPPPGFIPPSQPIFPAYQAPFPPPHMVNKGRGGGGGGGYWQDDNKKGEWRGGRGGGKFRGRGRASRWDRGAGNNSNWNRQGGDTDLRTFNDFSSSSKDKDERKDWPAPGQADRDERDQDRFRDRREDRDRNRDRDRREDRDRERGGRDYERDRDRDYDRDRDWESRGGKGGGGGGGGGGGREWDRNRERDKDRDWDRDKDKNRDRDKDRDRGRSRRRD